MPETEKRKAELCEDKQTDVTPEDRRRQFQEHMKRWRNSGLSQAEYCRHNGLDRPPETFQTDLF